MATFQDLGIGDLFSFAGDCYPSGVFERVSLLGYAPVGRGVDVPIEHTCYCVSTEVSVFARAGVASEARPERPELPFGAVSLAPFAATMPEREIAGPDLLTAAIAYRARTGRLPLTDAADEAGYYLDCAIEREMARRRDAS